MTDRILLIDDDQRLADMLGRWLGSRGFEVTHRADIVSGEEALRSPTGQPWAALLLDLSLPDGDGLDLCRRVRATDPALPIVMLTARGDPMDRVLGLELGADDYLGKPFDPMELLARVKALLRRARLSTPAAQEGWRFGPVEIDLGARVVRRGGVDAVLTSHQFNLLVVLAERRGRVVSREALMRAVRGEELDAFDRSIDVHVSRIRAAIEDDPRHPRLIRTVRGAGYVFTGEA